MGKRREYNQILKVLPSMMEANLNDDLDYLPWEKPDDYAELILNEIEYERGEKDPIYSKTELDKLEAVCNEILNANRAPDKNQGFGE